MRVDLETMSHEPMVANYPVALGYCIFVERISHFLCFSNVFLYRFYASRAVDLNGF